MCPIPACKQPRATRVLTSKAGGPLVPDLCSPDVLTLFSLPQKSDKDAPYKAFMTKLKMSPLCEV